MIDRNESRSKKKRFAAWENGVKVIFGIALSLSLFACASTTQKKIEIPATARVEMSLEEKWGIQLQPIRLTAAGYMIDFRYRVIDPEKAAPLLSRNVHRYVMVEKSKAILQVPSTEKLGMLRSAVSTPAMVKKDRIYAALFANPGRHVKAGDKITIVLGEFKAENLMVN
jgi:hypothetical protein